MVTLWHVFFTAFVSHEQDFVSFVLEVDDTRLQSEWLNCSHTSLGLSLSLREHGLHHGLINARAAHLIVRRRRVTTRGRLCVLQHVHGRRLDLDWLLESNLFSIVVQEELVHFFLVHQRVVFNLGTDVPAE